MGGVGSGGGVGTKSFVSSLRIQDFSRPIVFPNLSSLNGPMFIFFQFDAIKKRSSSVS